MTTETLNKVQDTEALVNDTRKAELLKTDIRSLPVILGEDRAFRSALSNGKAPASRKDA